MSFFSALKNGSLYERRLNALGVNPRNYPPDLHSSICSLAESYGVGGADMLRLAGRARSEHIQESILRAADVFAVVTLAPQGIRATSLYAGIIKSLALDFVTMGDRSTQDLKVLHLINQAGYFHKVAAEDFFEQRDLAQE